MHPSSLKNCIATLIQLRNAYESQLDASVLEELDDVIADLEAIRDNDKSKKRLGPLSDRALQLIDYIVRLVTNITDLMK